jgi:LAO/AO transport system kinase
MTNLAERVAAGDRRALGRLLSQIEREDPEAQKILAGLNIRPDRALVIGITGASGTGKSTLVNALTRVLRKGTTDEPPQTVGILAVDPSSPFSGGAILGDRIRMRDLAGDDGVFIRSMASRGHLGGLSRATDCAVRALDAAGFEIIIIETVGAGQDEVEIARQADTVIVLETPGLGDDIQAIKAGILEIADVLAVNKADLPGAEAAAASLEAMLNLEKKGEDGWRTPIVSTVAATGEGMQALAAAVFRHRDYLKRSGEWARREQERAGRNLEERLRERLFDRWKASAGENALADAVRKVASRECSMEEALERLLLKEDAAAKSKG